MIPKPINSVGNKTRGKYKSYSRGQTLQNVTLHLVEGCPVRTRSVLPKCFPMILVSGCWSCFTEHARGTLSPKALRFLRIFTEVSLSSDTHPKLHMRKPPSDTTSSNAGTKRKQGYRVTQNATSWGAAWQGDNPSLSEGSRVAGATQPGRTGAVVSGCGAESVLGVCVDCGPAPGMLQPLPGRFPSQRSPNGSQGEAAASHVFHPW